MNTANTVAGAAAVKPRVTAGDLNRAVAAVGGARNVDDVYPLAPLQHGILFHSLYAEHGPVYVAVARWRLTGTVDVAALAKAWRLLLDRHTILRTAFIVHGMETPLQVVVRHAELPFTYLDWRETPVRQIDQRLEQLVEEERDRVFDLERPPLMRVTLGRSSLRSLRCTTRTL